MNNIDERFADLCALSNLVIGGSVFQRKDTQGNLGIT